jgi:hypothetical protein
MGLEGIVSKRKSSPYRSGRSSDWLKMKNPACVAVKRKAEEDRQDSRRSVGNTPRAWRIGLTALTAVEAQKEGCGAPSRDQRNAAGFPLWNTHRLAVMNQSHCKSS